MAASWEELPKKERRKAEHKTNRKAKKENLQQTKKRWTGHIHTPGPKPSNKGADIFVGLWMPSASLAQAFVGPVWGNIQQSCFFCINPSND